MLHNDIASPATLTLVFLQNDPSMSSTSGQLLSSMKGSKELAAQACQEEVHTKLFRCGGNLTQHPNKPPHMGFQSFKTHVCSPQAHPGNDLSISFKFMSRNKVRKLGCSFEC